MSALLSQINNTAHQGAFGHNPRSEPTLAQLAAGNYKKGVVMVKGLSIAIENPAYTYRKGMDKSGKEWMCLMQAHYGYIQGHKGNDGDEMDVFIGNVPENDTVYIVNQKTADGYFDEHKIMLGFLSQQQAVDTYQHCFERGWTGLMSVVPCTMTQFKWWLANGNKSRPVTLDRLPYAGLERLDSVIWGGNDGADLASHSGQVHKLLYQIRQCDDTHQALEPLSYNDLVQELGNQGFMYENYDALVVEYNKLEKKAKQLLMVMQGAASTVKPMGVTVGKPLTKGGVANVVAWFEMDDGQAVGVFFHNPDKTPKKIDPTDEMISYKWVLNKKDITIAVAPEQGKDLIIRTVAKRIMQLVEKNHDRFIKANGDKAALNQAEQDLTAQVAEKQATLKALQDEVAALQAKKAEAARLEQEKATIAEKPYSENITDALVAKYGWAVSDFGSSIKKSFSGMAAAGEMSDGTRNLTATVLGNGRWIGIEDVKAATGGSHVLETEMDMRPYMTDAEGGAKAFNDLVEAYVAKRREEVKAPVLKTTGKLSTPQELVQVAMSRKEGNKAFVELGEVTADVAQKVKDATGEDVTGWVHGLDEAAVRHILKEHGDPAIEEPRGQVAVTEQDIASIKQVLEMPDSIEKSEDLNDGTKTVTFKKLIGDKIVCVQEVRIGRKKLAVKTLWRVRSVPPAVAETSVVPTSETSARNSPQTIETIAQPPQSATQERPANWRTNLANARAVAKSLGIETKGKKLDRLVKDIYIFDGNEMKKDLLVEFVALKDRLGLPTGYVFDLSKAEKSVDASFLDVSAWINKQGNVDNNDISYVELRTNTHPERPEDRRFGRIVFAGNRNNPRLGDKLGSGMDSVPTAKQAIADMESHLINVVFPAIEYQKVLNSASVDVVDLPTLGVATITSVGSENINIEKDGKYYISKVGNTEHYALGEWDFAKYPEGNLPVSESQPVTTPSIGLKTPIQIDAEKGLANLLGADYGSDDQTSLEDMLKYTNWNTSLSDARAVAKKMGISLIGKSLEKLKGEIDKAIAKSVPAQPTQEDQDREFLQSAIDEKINILDAANVNKLAELSKVYTQGDMNGLIKQAKQVAIDAVKRSVANATAKMN